MNKLCLIWLFGALLAWSGVLSAQTGQKELEETDLLYLKGGTILKGRLLQYVQGGHISFLLSTGDTLRYAERGIRRIVQGAEVSLRRPYSFREKGFYAQVQTGFNSGRRYNGSFAAAWSAQLSAGHRWQRLLGAGLGIGIDGYASDYGEIIYPVFAEIRGELLKRNLSPYYVVKAGYGIFFQEGPPAPEEGKGGLFLQPALGIRWGGSAALNFTTELGFQYQKAQYTRSFGWLAENRNVEDYEYKRVTFRLGLLF